MSKSACGPQTELMSNNAVRVTRCTCGTVHVTLVASGVTVRMQADAFRNVVAGLRGFKLGAQLGTTSYSYIVDHVKPSSQPSVYQQNAAAVWDSAFGSRVMWPNAWNSRAC